MEGSPLNQEYEYCLAIRVNLVNTDGSPNSEIMKVLYDTVGGNTFNLTIKKRYEQKATKEEIATFLLNCMGKEYRY